MSAHIKSPKLGSLHHAFLSRRGGVSCGLYCSLNCGPGSNDDPASVAENRRIAASVISERRDTPLLTCYQFHSDQVAVATSDWGEDRPKADAMVTNRPGLILGILTADCTPVLFADEKAGVIGAAHAGWKGAFAGVIENAVNAMEALGAARKNINAAIGPTIRQTSYEVDQNFRANFIAQTQTSARFFAAGKDTAHFQFDLPSYVHSQLDACNLGSIWDSGIDTYASSDHFSYRRTTHKNEADYGRQLSAIMLPG